MPKTLCEDATAYLERIHCIRLKSTRDPIEKQNLENYDYSHFNAEAFESLAKERFTKRQWLVFTRLFGLDENPAENPTELAARLGISPAGVYVLKDAGYRQLRNVWDFIFTPTPWDGRYKDSDRLGVLPLSNATWHYLARLGLNTVKDFKAIDEQFMGKYFFKRKAGAAEVRTLLEKLRNEE